MEQIGWRGAGEPNPGGSRPAGRVSDPTGGRVVMMEADPEYQTARRRVQLVEYALQVLNKTNGPSSRPMKRWSTR